MSGRTTERSAGHDTGDADLARQLLHVTMMLWRSIGREMRRAPQALAPGQMAALMRLSMGPAATGELARHIGVSVPTVSRSIDVLVNRAWVERIANPSDRRHTIIRLTAAGRRVTAAMKRQSQRHVATLLAPLTSVQREKVIAALDALERVLPPLP